MNEEIHKALYLAEQIKTLYEQNISMLSYLRDRNKPLAGMLDATSDTLAKKKAVMFHLYNPPRYKDFQMIYQRMKSGVVPIEALNNTIPKLDEILWFLKYQNAYYRFYELYSGASKYQHSKNEVMQMASYAMNYIKQHPQGTKYQSKSWKDEFEKVQFNYCDLYFKKQSRKTK